MTETLVIYHGGCRDGFCAAWVVWKYYSSIEGRADYPIQFIPGFYGQEPPDCKGKDVIIVDFCYPLDVMQKILAECDSLLWMDHHKTAIPVFDSMMQFVGGATRLKVIFDLERSGAGIAWDYLFGGAKRPWLVDYVEDRDLWAKKLENSDWVNSYIACLAFDFKVWNLIADSITLTQAMHNGVIATAKTEQYVREVCKNVYFVEIVPTNYMPFKDMIIYKNIPIVNICQVNCSEVLHELCKLYSSSPFSLYWFKRADGMYQYGLRSIGDFDVSSVAKLFGGGGHKNASGFQLNYLLEELK